MLAHSYETRLVCDNCGAVVSRESVDAATFERLTEDADPAFVSMDREATQVLDAGDLVEEEADGEVEVLIQHVSVCHECGGSP